jgi:hypothetical protein
MPDDREERIRARAHQLWESEGRPSGREAEHWEQARREIEAEEAGGAPLDSSGAGGLGHEEMTADVQSGGAGALGEAATPAVPRRNRPRAMPSQRAAPALLRGNGNIATRNPNDRNA